ncbi:hypothetical protein [Prevotella pallens]|uniref:hypothetical protein n=1 Tax=Prevotella pallens TaxID=60133 RepID=UPI0003A4A227|nr:hypothetical protein [Prevotella pallens]
MKCTQSKGLPIAKITVLPSIAYLFKGKSSLLQQRVKKPDVSVECLADHLYFIPYSYYIV